MIMAKKAFNTFGSSRASVTPSTNLSTTLTTTYGGVVASNISTMILLSRLDTTNYFPRRNDKNFYHRIREYVNTALYPVTANVATVGWYSTTNNTSWWEHYRKADVTLQMTKYAVTGSATGTVVPSSEAWKTFAGKLPLGFPCLFMFQPTRGSLASPYQYRGDLAQQVCVSATPSQLGNYSSQRSVAVSNYETQSVYKSPEYTPFNFTPDWRAVSNSAPHAQLEHPMNDTLSGCTVGSKKSTTAILSDLRDIFLKEVMSYCNHITVRNDLSKLINAIYASVNAGDTQPYISLGNLGLEDVSSIVSLLNSMYCLASLGSNFTGGSTGLVHFEGSAASAFVNLETIERAMSNYVFSKAGGTPSDVTGNEVFTKTGRIGALRSQLLVFGDNLSRKKYELGLVDSKPSAPYAGLLSSRPLGQFNSFSTSDGWSCEVRLKDTQLSLISFGMSHFATGASCLGVMLGTISGSIQSVASGLFSYGSLVKLAYTKLNSVTTTLDASSCKVFGWGTVISATTSGYTSVASIQDLTPVGGIDPTTGTRHTPTNSTVRASVDTTPIKILCAIPYNVDDMKVDGSGNVPYFDIASGSSSVFGQWSCKAAFGYLKGSYNLYTRLTTYGQLKAIYGSTKTVEECVDLATTAFITECLGYITVADTDPNPFEQYMAYTPLQYVGYDLPPMRSWDKRFYDYKVYDPYGSDSTVNRNHLKRSNSLGGMLSGTVGSRVDRVVKPYYGSATSSRENVDPNYLDARSRWMANLQWDTGKVVMDSQNGIYYNNEAEQVKAKWGGGKLMRLKPTDQTDAQFKQGGRVGFRAASMNYGCLIFSAIMYRHDVTSLKGISNVNKMGNMFQTAYSLNNTNRQFGLQADISPELLDIAMLQSDMIGKPRDNVATSLGLYAYVGSTSYLTYVPLKYTQFDYTTNATRVLSGVAMRNDVPTDGLLVRLQDRITGDILAVQMSQKGGKYRFYGCQPHREYLVSTIDPLREFTADIEDVKEST